MAIIESDTLPFDYDIVFSKKRRSVQFAIVQGRLKVKAPLGISALFLQQLLLKKQAWVLKHLESSLLAEPPVWTSRKEILIGGQFRPFHWVFASKGAVVLQDQDVQVQVPTRVHATRRDRYIQQQIQRYFTELAQPFFAEHVQQQALLMSVAPAAVRIGNWQRRWGYCDSNGILGFNWRLMQAPDWVARYVIIHELAHLRYMNHSAGFWQLVEQFCTDHALAKRWLKQNQQHLM